MARQTKQERLKQERRTAVGRLSLTVFELDGKLTQTLRHARQADLGPVVREVEEIKARVEKIRASLRNAVNRWSEERNG